jgi:hypothetical protein
MHYLCNWHCIVPFVFLLFVFWLTTIFFSLLFFVLSFVLLKHEFHNLLDIKFSTLYFLLCLFVSILTVFLLFGVFEFRFSLFHWFSCFSTRAPFPDFLLLITVCVNTQSSFFSKFVFSYLSLLLLGSRTPTPGWRIWGNVVTFVWFFLSRFYLHLFRHTFGRSYFILFHLIYFDYNSTLLFNSFLSCIVSSFVIGWVMPRSPFHSFLFITSSIFIYATSLWLHLSLRCLL